MAVYLTNGFEAGSNGSGVTALNSGDSADNAFDIVVANAGATILYTNAQAAHGSQCGIFTEPSSSQTCIVEWSASLTASSIPQVWFRAYCYIAANPPASFRIVTAFSSGAFNGGVTLNTSGKLVTNNAAGTGETTSTATVPLGAWFRIEGYVIGSATVGQVSVSLYDSVDSATPTETDTTPANLNTTGAIDAIRFGDPSGGTSFSFYLDDLGASDTGPLGPSQFSGSPVGAVSLAAPVAGSKRCAGASTGAAALSAIVTGFKRFVAAVTGAVQLTASAVGEPAGVTVISGLLSGSIHSASGKRGSITQSNDLDGTWL
jgi:hypothetical protein